MTQLPKSAMTHGGKFHADDVFSFALLKIINPEIEIKRTFDVPAGFDGLVFDIGGGAFDHHQSGAEVRKNGVPYAAFGLLWRAFGADLIGAEEAARLDEKFIQPLDADDNTGCGSPVTAILSAFNPGWDSEENPDDCFAEAVSFAQVILQKKLDQIRGNERARALVSDGLARMQDGIVILPRFAPWKKFLEKSDAMFVVYPSQRGGYSAQGVPSDEEPNPLKCPFPAAWAGKSPEELQLLSGLETLRFCHNSRFLITTGTQEDALAACQLARQAAQ